METDKGQQGYRFRVGKNRDITLTMSHAEYKRRQEAGRVARRKRNMNLAPVVIGAVVFLVFACLTIMLLPVYLG